MKTEKGYTEIELGLSMAVFLPTLLLAVLVCVASFNVHSANNHLRDWLQLQRDPGFTVNATDSSTWFSPNEAFLKKLVDPTGKSPESLGALQKELSNLVIYWGDLCVKGGAFLVSTTSLKTLSQGEAGDCSRDPTSAASMIEAYRDECVRYGDAASLSGVGINGRVCLLVHVSMMPPRDFVWKALEFVTTSYDLSVTRVSALRRDT